MSQEQFQAVINSPWMWLACGVMVFIVIAQSVVYLRSAIREADRLGIDAKRRHGAIRSACITSLGPSLSPVIIALSMITIIGAPNTWLYLNNVGAARTELATVAILAAMGGAEVQVRSHVEGAIKAGNTAEEIVCALAHAMPYMGVPRLFNALNCAKEILDRRRQ